MEAVVVDASAALLWCLKDEHPIKADQFLEYVSDKMIAVPSIWGLELANCLIQAERKVRLRSADTAAFITFLNSLTIITPEQPYFYALGITLPLAKEYNLTSYDAAYLELAMSRRLPLITMDEKLKAAAKKAGVTVL